MKTHVVVSRRLALHAYNAGTEYVRFSSARLHFTRNRVILATSLALLQQPDSAIGFWPSIPVNQMFHIRQA